MEETTINMEEENSDMMDENIVASKLLNDVVFSTSDERTPLLKSTSTRPSLETSLLYRFMANEFIQMLDPDRMRPTIINVADIPKTNDNIFHFKNKMGMLREYDEKTGMMKNIRVPTHVISETTPEKKKTIIYFSLFFKSMDLIPLEDIVDIKTTPEVKKLLKSKKITLYWNVSQQTYQETKTLPIEGGKVDENDISQNIAIIDIPIDEDHLRCDKLTAVMMEPFAWDIKMDKKDPRIVDYIELYDPQERSKEDAHGDVVFHKIIDDIKTYDKIYHDREVEFVNQMEAMKENMEKMKVVEKMETDS